MLENTQLSFMDTSDEYKNFVEKFKPKKTTDDCYTPANIYKVVLDWVVEQYGIDPDNVVRPFYPGGDYERFHYPDGCTVVDNPPFSILEAILRTYTDNNIKFFLFAPYLTNFTPNEKVTSIICPVSITYENGARVDSSFLTNLDSYRIRGCPDLYQKLKAADDENRKEKVKQLPKYDYPNEVLTASMVGLVTRYGVEFKVKKEDCFFYRALESQREAGKALFGGGYLLSEKAAAEKAAAEKAAAEKAAAEKAAAEKIDKKVWTLSERERLLIQSLGE